VTLFDDLLLEVFVGDVDHVLSFSFRGIEVRQGD